MSGAPGQPVTACIAMGSNLGDRTANIREGIRLTGGIEGVRVERVSDLIQTDAVRVGEAEPGGPYLNGAAVVTTHLPARRLLARLHEVEAALGRRRGEEARGAARTLDLDLLLFGDQVVDEPGLRVPHPGLHERLFVLKPLAQVAAEVVVPTLGRTVGELLAALQRRATVVVAALACLLGVQGGMVARAGAQGLEVTAGLALEEAARGYQRGPSAERVTISVRSKRPGAAGRTETTRGEIVVRMDPGKANEARPRALLLELGRLRAFAGEGVLTAVATGADETFWRREYDPARDLTPARLAEILQPVPLPQVALVRAMSNYERTELLPWIGGVQWEPVAVEARAESPLYQLKGRSDAGRVEVDIEPPGVGTPARLRRVLAELPARGGGGPGAEGPTIEMTFAPMPPGDPAGWRIDTQGRRGVATLKELLTRQSDGVLGQAFPLTWMTTRAGKARTIGGLFAGLEPGEEDRGPLPEDKPPTWLVLVLERPGATRVHRDAASAVVAEVREQLGSGTEGTARVGSVRVLVEGANAPARIEHDCWAPSAALVRIAPGAVMALVAIDIGGTIRGVVALDYDSDADAAADRLRGMMEGEAGKER